MRGVGGTTERRKACSSSHSAAQRIACQLRERHPNKTFFFLGGRRWGGGDKRRGGGGGGGGYRVGELFVDREMSLKIYIYIQKCTFVRFGLSFAAPLR